MEPPRNIEIVEDLAELRKQYAKLRYLPLLQKENNAKPWGALSARNLAAKAIGWSPSYAEAISILTGNAEKNPELARRVALIKQGKETVHGAYNAWRRRLSGEEVPVKPDEVRTTFTRGLQTLETTIEAMGKFGSMLMLPVDERAAYVQQINGMRTKLFAVARDIREGLNMEAKEGTEE